MLPTSYAHPAENGNGPANYADGGRPSRLTWLRTRQATLLSCSAYSRKDLPSPFNWPLTETVKQTLQSKTRNILHKNPQQTSHPQANKKTPSLYFQPLRRTWILDQLWSVLLGWRWGHSIQSTFCWQANNAWQRHTHLIVAKKLPQTSHITIHTGFAGAFISTFILQSFTVIPREQPAFTTLSFAIRKLLASGVILLATFV